MYTYNNMYIAARNIYVYSNAYNMYKTLHIAI